MKPKTAREQFCAEDEERRRAAFRSLLSTADGRFLFNHIVTLTEVYRKAGSLEPDKLAYDAGRRDIGLDIIALARHSDPEKTFLAETERVRLMTERARIIALEHENANKDKPK